MYFVLLPVAAPLPTPQHNCHGAPTATALHHLLGGTESIARLFKRNAHWKRKK